MNRERFLALWQRLAPHQGEAGANAVFQQLCTLYAEEARSYHNASHINFCLSYVDHYQSLFEDCVAAELAIWFHDACYGPEPQGHESRSAELFRRLANGADPALVERVCALIEATTHCTAPVDADAALVVDIDLASFSRPWAAFLKDTLRCRAERRQLHDRDFCYCQKEFLASLLARPSLYFSVPFQRHHEAQARANINRLIRLLEQRALRWAGHPAQA